MQSMNSAVLLSRGSVWNPQPHQPPFLGALPGQTWPLDALGANIVFTDTSGGVLAELDGTVSPERIQFIGDPEELDAVPAGANFEIFLDTMEGPYQIRYGKVIRKEVQWTTTPAQILTPALAFGDNFQRSALGRKWVGIRGQTKIHDNSLLSLPNGVSVKNSFFNESAIRFWQPFNSDTIEVGVSVVNPLNLQAGKTGLIICADINLNTGLVAQLETGIGNDYLHLGVLDGPTTVVYQGSPIGNVTEDGDYYRLRYVHSTKTFTVYKGTSLEPLGTFIDESGIVPHGKGYTYVGFNWEASLLTQGIQVTSWAGKDAV